MKEADSSSLGYAHSIRVLLGDDQPEVLSALRLLLEQEPGLTVVGEATDHQRLLEQAETLDSNLLILDWELPDHQAFGLLPTLHSRFPNLHVVALSSRPEAREAALLSGADSFVFKGDPPECLLEVVRRLR
ncbi:MAG: response regulator transcription factor [Chloroflexi bacterium]|nr:response regulator transcription factor [Chloroflexota bacterium]